jgi:hypothetical protein
VCAYRGALVSLNGLGPMEGDVSWKDKLRKVLLLAMLGMGGLMGATMNPKEIEDLMRIMNQTQIEIVVKKEFGDDDWKLTPDDPDEKPP